MVNVFQFWKSATSPDRSHLANDDSIDMSLGRLLRSYHKALQEVVQLALQQAQRDYSFFISSEACAGFSKNFTSSNVEHSWRLTARADFGAWSAARQVAVPLPGIVRCWRQTGERCEPAGTGGVGQAVAHRGEEFGTQQRTYAAKKRPRADLYDEADGASSVKQGSGPAQPLASSAQRLPC